MGLTFFEILLLVIGLYLVTKIVALEGQIRGMKDTLNELAKHSDLPESPINDEVLTLIEGGEDVKAVKLVRERLGLTLLEAKQYTDKLKDEQIDS
ncbi:MAG TPA: hypothetical protein VK067_00150 [Pseudogracilibacillus sp.]|nr:hypothetical protein [Pseudogracilibacillus sp.]